MGRKEMNKRARLYKRAHRGSENLSRQMRYHQQRRAALEYKGNECEICGTKRRLEFRHKKGTLKFRNVSDMFSNYDWFQIENELDKCVLICRPCYNKLLNKKVI
ncbi:hypothetical protein KY320_01490 [Candidatus Woesearchaeota archaeon]|nr:hypothetical protein [Candidatus Woesearchaeota archaeon]